jgi:NAD+ kinase
MRTAIVVANPKKKDAVALRSKVVSFLKSSGINVAPRGGTVVAIGGDGTILFNKRHYGKPFFGIGSASSYLCHATEHDWKERLGHVVRHGYKTEKRLLLASSLDGKRLPDALNEVCVRNKEHRILYLFLTVDGRKFKFRADGVLFSTPTGSSAYCYSCGGDEIERNARAFEIVGIAPFRRTFKPHIVNENAKCHLVVESECDADVVIDGQYVYPIKRKSRIEVWKSEKDFLFVK